MAQAAPRRRSLAAHLKRRNGDGSGGGGGSGAAAFASSGPPAATGPAGRMRPAEVDAAWRQLLEETLPEDKQDALMETYSAETDPQIRYNMLLEFSSYLRQGAGDGVRSKFDDETDPDEKYRLKPKMRRPRGFDDDDDANLCWEITRVLLIVGGILVLVLGTAYYLGSTSADGGAGILPHMGSEPEADEGA